MPPNVAAPTRALALLCLPRSRVPWPTPTSARSLVAHATAIGAALPLVAASACAAPSARPTPATPAPAVATFDGPEAEQLRATERARLRALVAADMDAARLLHADDFQVVNPLGRAFSKDQYLGGVASGTTDYHAWEADSIAVRIYGSAAALRYQSQVEMTVRGERRAGTRAWNTALYERRNGRWQIVWFQVTDRQ